MTDVIADIVRRNTVLLHEGQTLAFLSQHRGGDGVTLARCMIDGGINALVRVSGRKETAEFVYSLADRIGDQLQVFTKGKQVLIKEDQPVPEPAVVQEPVPDMTIHELAVTRIGQTIRVLLAGLATGLALGIVIGVLVSHV